jgi:hypothetical protein
MALFDEMLEDKYEAETIPVDYTIFSEFKINSLCVVLITISLGQKGQCHLEER